MGELRPYSDPVERTGRQIELADAGLRLVAGEGMGSVTFRAVAAESGWSLGAVQRAFGSKEDLQAAMLERLRTSVEPQVPGEPGRPTLHAWLVELVIAVAPFDDRRRAMQRQGHAFAELAPFDDRIGRIIAEDDDRLRALLARLVRRAQSEGEIENSVDAEGVAWSVLALMQGVASQLLYDMQSEADVRRWVDAVVQGVLHL